MCACFVSGRRIASTPETVYVLSWRSGPTNDRKLILNISDEHVTSGSNGWHMGTASSHNPSTLPQHGEQIPVSESVSKLG